MGKNNKGLYYKYNWLVEAFRDLGFEACKLGIEPKLLLERMKRMYPGRPVAKHDLEYVRATLSIYRVGRDKLRTDRTRSPELFEMLGNGLWTLKEFEETRLAEERRVSAERVAQEGKAFFRRHLARERSSLADEFKRQLKDLNCEACGFNFELSYGELGRGYIEAHHILPLGAGPRKTSVEDFRAVCANCHRMIHRKGLITVEMLRSIIFLNSA